MDSIWKRFSWILRAAGFLAGLAVLYVLIQPLFLIGNKDDRILFRAIYAETGNKTDAIYLGASNVYTYWQAPLAWKDHGIAVLPVSNPMQPGQSVRYMIEEARKEQPDALCIINLNSLKSTELEPSTVHFQADYMRPSGTKYRMIMDLCDRMKLSWQDRLEYFFPILRFHGKWSELKSRDFVHNDPDLKGAITYSRFVKKSRDLTRKTAVIEEEVPLTEGQTQVLGELMDYCREESLEVLFAVVPQGIKDPETLGQFNTMARIVRENGFPVLNLSGAFEELGLDLKRDFYNANHTNIHGSIKYTEYLSAYLKEHYGFGDKRGMKGYESWEKAAEDYDAFIRSWTLDFERQHASRDYRIPEPAGVAVTVDGTSVSLSWQPSEGADGYSVYRRYKKQDWELCTETDAGTLSFSEEGLRKNKKYSYTVVPWKKGTEGKIYGNFNYYGTEILTEK